MSVSRGTTHSSKSSTRRRTSAVRRACEPLERRTMLTTYVINGTAGNDSFSIQDFSGQLYVNGSFVPSSGVTDIQVNGFDGNDSLAVYDAQRAVVFNGGNGDDTLTLSGGDLGRIAAQVNFNGGAGYDLAVLNDNIENVNTTYEFAGNSFDRIG